MTADSTETLGNHLIEAVRQDNLGEVIRLLSLGADINTQDELFGQTPISCAAGQGNYEVVETLYNHGANLEIPDHTGRTPADYAVRRSHKVFSYLLSLEQTASQKHFRGQSILFLLAAFGDPLDVERFAASTAGPDPRDDDGLTPLMYASRWRRADSVSVLLRAGANPLLEDEGRRTALYHAADGGDIPTIHALLDFGVDPNNLGSFSSSEPLAPDANLRTVRPALWAALAETEQWAALLTSKPDLSLGDSTGKTALHHAAAHGRVTAVERLLAAGIAVDARDGRGRTPLIQASKNGHLLTVDILLRGGAEAKLAETSSGTSFSETALQWAAQEGHSDVVKRLCPASDVDARGFRGRTAMIWAAQGGDMASVQALVEAGADLGIVDDDYGQSALSWAAENGALPVVAFLIRAGADLYTAESHGKTPISFALHNLDLVKVFIEEPRGTAVAEVGDEPIPRARAAELALRYSCENTDIEHPRAESAMHREHKDYSSVSRFILSQAEYLDRPDHYGRTLLSWAAESGYPEEMKLLCELDKLDCNSADNESRTPLHWAAGNGAVGVVKCLLDHGAMASLERLDSTQQTPIFKAAVQGHHKIMDLLLKRGASCHGRDGEGRTALSLVAEGGYVDCVELLLERGAASDSPDHHRRTPLSWAAEMGHAEVIKTLLPPREKKPEGKPEKKPGNTPRRVKKVRFQLKEGAKDDDDASAVDVEIISPDTVAKAKTTRTATARRIRGVGAEANSQDIIKNWTPLWYAAMNQHLAAFEALLEGGANPSATDASEKSLQERLEDKKNELRADAEANHAALAKLNAILEKLMSSGYIWVEPAADATAADKNFHATFLYIPAKDKQHLDVARKVLSLDKVLRGKRPTAPPDMSCAWIHLPANNVSAYPRVPCGISPWWIHRMFADRGRDGSKMRWVEV